MLIRATRKNRLDHVRRLLEANEQVRTELYRPSDGDYRHWECACHLQLTTADMYRVDRTVVRLT